MVAAVYTQRRQDRLQRVASEITKRETVYADFVISASKLLLNAFIHDEIALGAEEQLLLGLLNRIRLFAPPDFVGAAEAVLRGIVEISLKPRIEARQLAKLVLAKNLDPDPVTAFSSVAGRTSIMCVEGCRELITGGSPCALPAREALAAGLRCGRVPSG